MQGRGRAHHTPTNKGPGLQATGHGGAGVVGWGGGGVVFCPGEMGQCSLRLDGGQSRLEVERPARRLPAEEINTAWCAQNGGLTPSHLFIPPSLLRFQVVCIKLNQLQLPRTLPSPHTRQPWTLGIQPRRHQAAKGAPPPTPLPQTASTRSVP